MADVPPRLGVSVAQERAERQITPSQLAERLHIRPATISMIESGELEPTEEIARSLRTWMASKEPAPKPASKGLTPQKRTTIQR